MDWWSTFWLWVDESQFRANLIATVVAAAVIGGLASVKKLREPALDAARRSWKAITSVRLTTTTRMEALSDSRMKPIKENLTPGTGEVFGLAPAQEFPPMAPVVEKPVPEPEPDPVSWSVRAHAGEIILRNLSKTESAFNVAARSSSIMTGWSNQALAWSEIEPGTAVSFVGVVNPSRRGGRVVLRVVWEDADGRAIEESVPIVGV